jgi:CheY-like chemotaxis protein
VLTNLITNAVKFTQHGSVEFGCRFQNPNQLLFWVRDTGIGIPSNKLETIFMPFQQANDSTHEQYGGSGLGLAISKGLVKLWGGEIWTESEPGVGSIFFFTMAFVEASHKTTAQLLQLHYKWAGKSILLLTNDPANTHNIIELLTQIGLEVVHVMLGKEGLEQVRKKMFSLAIIDISLLDMSGFEVAKVIRESYASLPIIALTAYDNIETRLKCDEIGLDYFLTKPITHGKLIVTLDKLLG